MARTPSDVSEVATSGPTPLDRQSDQLLGYLDALFRKLMLPRKTDEEPALDCSRDELRVLMILHSAQRIIMSDLAEAIGTPVSTATHTVDRLVTRGLVVRNRSDEDRRVVRVELSENGKRLQETFRLKRGAMARSWLEPLS